MKAKVSMQAAMTWPLPSRETSTSSRCRRPQRGIPGAGMMPRFLASQIGGAHPRRGPAQLTRQWASSIRFESR